MLTFAPMTRSERITFYALSLFLFLPNLMGACLAVDIASAADRAVYLVCALLFYLLGLALLKRRTFFYVASVSFLFAAVEIVHLVVNRATTSLLFVYTCVISEKGEFLELLSSYWFVVVAFFALWGVYFYCAHRFIRNEYTVPFHGRHGRIAAGIVLPLCICVYALIPALRQTMLKVSPLNICVRLQQISSLEHDITRSEQNLHSFSYGIQPVADTDSTVVVFLIGETSRYDHWQLNGYARPTSPYMLARAEAGQLISFDSCYSIANLTTVSVPLMLSRATPQQPRLYLQEQSLVDAFHEADYYTAWIADQSFTNRFLLQISGRCDYAQYIRDDKRHECFVDTVLLAPLQSVLAGSSPHKMIVLHSLGCHYKYSARYPESHRIYVPDKDGLNTSRKQVMVNSYDNAITFTDHFLERVIDQLEQTGKQAVLVYVGDHGENLLDDERGMFLHGTYSGSYYEYHVPLFVWTSVQWRAAHADKQAALSANQSKKISTMHLFHSLLDMAAISYDSLDASCSIVRPDMPSLPVVYGLDANLQPFLIPTQP